MALGLVVGLAGAACGLEVVDGSFRQNGAAFAVRGLWYPVFARRDGRRMDAASFVAKAKGSGINLLCLTVAEGPTADDAQALLDASAAASMLVALRPVPEADPGWVRRAAARFGAHPALAAWAVHGAAPEAVTALRSGAARPVLSMASVDEAPPATALAEALLATTPALYQTGYGFGVWGRLLSGQATAWGGPWLGDIECAPPAWLIQDQILAAAAPQPDLYPDSDCRPETAVEAAGEYLLIPEPAQIRLATYAAIGSGARGVVFDHAGHLGHGPDPFNGADRAAMVTWLAQELGWFEPFIAAGEVQELPVLREGVGAGLLRHGDDRLLLLWRDRRLDARSVGAVPVAAFDLDLTMPTDEARKQHVYAFEPGRLAEQRPDVREAGLRLAVPGLDLTRAYLLSPQPQDRLVAEVAASLPETAARAVFLATRRWHKIDFTLKQLEQEHKSAGGRRLATLAAARLVEAEGALGQGLHRSALDLGLEAERLLRAAQSLELESAVAEPLLPQRSEHDRITFAALPSYFDPRPKLPTGPFELAPGGTVSVGFDKLPAGSIPPRWTAMRGLDQTVATLTVVDGGADGTDRALRWLPVGADPGAISLPFTPQPNVEVEVMVRVDQALAGPRWILLAPQPGAAPVAGVVLMPSGDVHPWPAGETTSHWRPGQWQGIKVSGSSVGALVLAKPAGEDPHPVTVDQIVVHAMPQGE